LKGKKNNTMATNITVIVVKENIHKETILITGNDSKKVVKKAEEVFFDKIKEYSSEYTWKSISDEDRETILDDGHFDPDRDTDIYFYCPTVKKV